MTGNTRGWSLANFRFAGYSDLELADVIDELGHGPGAGGMTAAANNLHEVATALHNINTTLGQQLGAIGVAWQSRQASAAAHRALGGSQSYSQDAQGQVAVSATSIDEHGDAYRAARLGLPDSSALRDPGYPSTPGFTGNEVDHSEAVRRQAAARDQTIDAMTGYTGAAQRSVDAHQPLDPVQPIVHHEPPPTHHEQPVGGSTSPAGTAPPVLPAPSGGAPAAPVTGGAPAGGQPLAPAPVVGGGPLTGAPIPGSGSAGVPGVVEPVPGVYPAPVAGRTAGGVPAEGGVVGGAPRVGSGFAGARIPVGEGFSVGGGTGGVPAGGVVPGPGARMGAGAFEAEGSVGGIAGAANAVRAGGLGAGASAGMNAIAGGASGAGAAAAGAESGDRLVRGRPGGTPLSREGAMSGVEPEGSAASRAASRVSSEGGRSRSLMEPAAGTSRQEDDGSHVRRYGVEPEDLFADPRMVANPVLGDEPE